MENEIKGTLYNDVYINSKNNWLFYEIESNKPFLISENQTDTLNKMVLENPFFYSTIFKAKRITEFIIEVIF